MNSAPSTKSSASSAPSISARNCRSKKRSRITWRGNSGTTRPFEAGKNRSLRTLGGSLGALAREWDEPLGEVAFRDSWFAETDELYSVWNFFALRFRARDYSRNPRLTLSGRARVCSRRMVHVIHRSIH